MISEYTTQTSSSSTSDSSCPASPCSQSLDTTPISLRQRCGLNLHISMPPPFSFRLKGYESTQTLVEIDDGISKIAKLEVPENGASPTPVTFKGHLEPHIATIPRRRRRIPTPAQLAAREIEELRQKEKSKCLQTIIPGISVAFADSDAIETAHSESFTHIITVIANDTVPHQRHSELSSTQQPNVQYLRLEVPSPVRDDGTTHLTPSQLLSAREFITKSGHSVAAPDSTSPRVLITTSADRAVDAMSIAACYVSLASGRGVQEVLMDINEEDAGVNPAWQGVVSSDGIDYIKDAVRQ